MLFLVINCPLQGTYDVVLSEMMFNTTIGEIVNGEKELTNSQVPKETKSGLIRRLTFSKVKVVNVKKSNEIEFLYANSVIVVSKNEKKGALTNQVTVTRYWQSVYSGFIESEHLFDLLNGPYDDIFVFDHYAVVIKN